MTDLLARMLDELDPSWSRNGRVGGGVVIHTAATGSVGGECFGTVVAEVLLKIWGSE